MGNPTPNFPSNSGLGDFLILNKKSPRISGTKNGGFPGHLIAGYFGGGFSLPLHKPYPYSFFLGEESPHWMVPEMFGEILGCPRKLVNGCKWLVSWLQPTHLLTIDPNFLGHPSNTTINVVLQGLGV